MAYPYKDFRTYVEALERAGLLVHIKEPVDKNTELIPLVRLQFRGLPEPQRKTFLFHQVTDGAGRSFPGKVVVGALAASRAVYGVATAGEAGAVWQRALSSPVAPVRVEGGPVKECILRGEALSASKGVDLFPHPISTPGFDPAPFLTSPYWITKDPETKVVNVGTYRGMVKGKQRIGLQLDTPLQHLAQHIAKARRLGLEKLEAAVVLGAVPALGLASVTKLPYAVSEYDVAGGIMGEPLQVVPCETVDLEVPAHAEIVFEGTIDLTQVEPEGPFGEASGYMGPRTLSPAFEVSAITHRKDPLYQAFISEFPPSESTLMRKIGFENVYTNFLKKSCNIDAVKQVAFYEMGTCNMMFVVQLDSPAPGQAWQALYAASNYEPSMGKVIVAVDGDIDPQDPHALIWALSFRMQPVRDVRIQEGKVPRLDPSAKELTRPDGASALLIDATLPGPYPPTSLPAKPYMEGALERWRRLGLPELSLAEPWHGYELGDWSEEARKEAALAVVGRYLETGQKLGGLGRAP